MHLFLQHYLIIFERVVTPYTRNKICFSLLIHICYRIDEDFTNNSCIGHWAHFFLFKLLRLSRLFSHKLKCISFCKTIQIIQTLQTKCQATESCLKSLYLVTWHNVLILGFYLQDNLQEIFWTQVLEPLCPDLIFVTCNILCAHGHERGALKSYMNWLLA